MVFDKTETEFWLKYINYNFFDTKKIKKALDHLNRMKKSNKFMFLDPLNYLSLEKKALCCLVYSVFVKYS